MVEVVRRPLAADGAGGMGEPPAVVGDVLGSKGLRAKPGEEVPLLVDDGRVVHAGVAADEVAPPRGAGLLHPDPHKAGRTANLAGRQCGGGVMVEAFLPRPEPSGAVPQPPPRRWRDNLVHPERERLHGRTCPLAESHGVSLALGARRRSRFGGFARNEA